MIPFGGGARVTDESLRCKHFAGLAGKHRLNARQLVTRSDFGAGDVRESVAGASARRSQ